MAKDALKKKKKPNIKVVEHDFASFEAFVEIAVDRINNAVAPPIVEVGIDPGTTGAIAFLCGDEAYVMDMPIQWIATTKTRKLNKKEKAAARKLGAAPKTITVHGKSMVFDNEAIYRVFRILDKAIARDCIRVVVEKAQVRNSSKQAAFAKNAPNSRFAKFGDTPLTGYKVGFGFGLWPLFLTSRRYSPAVGFFYPTPASWKKAAGLGTDKKQSRLMAIKLWPRLKDRLSLVKHHGRAEALLLALHGRKYWAGQTPAESEDE